MLSSKTQFFLEKMDSIFPVISRIQSAHTSFTITCIIVDWINIATQSKIVQKSSKLVF